MGPENALDVEGRGAEAISDGCDLGGGDEKENGGGINEASDQPWTGDAINLGTRAGDPQRAATRIARR
jgi:hypothetical protein